MGEAPRANGKEAGLGELLRRLGDDASSLVRGEVALAKLELREAVQTAARDSAKLGVALALGIVGALALTAAAIIGLAYLLDGRFGLSALIVGVVLILIAALLARSGMRALSSGALKPAATIDSIGESRDWARRELRELRRDLKGTPEHALEPAADAAISPASPAAQPLPYTAATRPQPERTSQP